MKRILLTGLVIVSAIPVAAEANRGYKAGNCAVYAEEAAKVVKADPRVTGDAEAELVDSLTKYAAHLNGIVESEMEQTYTQSAAFGWDKATVDAQMKAGEDAIRQGFVTPTMEADTVYADHLLAVSNCADGSARAGHLGAADVAKLGGRLNAVYMLIR